MFRSPHAAKAAAAASSASCFALCTATPSTHCATRDAGTLLTTRRVAQAALWRGLESSLCVPSSSHTTTRAARLVREKPQTCAATSSGRSTAAIVAANWVNLPRPSSLFASPASPFPTPQSVTAEEEGRISVSTHVSRRSQNAISGMSGSTPTMSSSAPVMPSSVSTSTTTSTGSTSTTASTSLHAQRRFASTTANPAEAEASAQTSSSSSADGGSEGEEPFEEAASTLSFLEVMQACKLLGLTTANGSVQADWTMATLKSVYHELVRTCHPDVDGGDKISMEQINVAYTRLRTLTDADRAAFATWLASGDYVTLGGRVVVQDGIGDTVQMMSVGLVATLASLALWGGSYWAYSYAVRRASGSSASATAAAAAVAAGHKGLAAKGSASSSSLTATTQTSLIAGSLGSARLFSACYTTAARYVLMAAVTIAACINTVLLRRVMLRLLFAAAP